MRLETQTSFEHYFRFIQFQIFHTMAIILQSISTFTLLSVTIHFMIFYNFRYDIPLIVGNFGAAVNSIGFIFKFGLLV